MIYLTSDLHIGHNKEFIYKARGFETIEQMNEEIVQRQNNEVNDYDEYFILGDATLGNFDDALPYLKALKGNIHLVRGNHDTDARLEKYKSELGWNVQDALYLKYNKIHFYLSHYPTLTGNLEKESIWQCLINLYGHTHQKNNFFYDLPYCYHVGVDSHDCKPVPIDLIIQQILEQVENCKNLL